MEEFCNEAEFASQQQLYDSIFGFCHKLLGLVMDTVTNAGGHVQSEIEGDVSLRQAIEQEGSVFVQYLTRRYQIVALTCIDTYNGKRREIANRPHIEPIDEINDNDNQDCGQAADVDGADIWSEQPHFPAEEEQA